MHRESLLSQVLGSDVMLGILIFLAANFLLALWNPLASVDPESLPAAHTWTWWATQEYLQQKHSPDLVILGSSLVMHPISRLDADYLNQNLDYVHHHRSDYLAQSLTRLATGSDIGKMCFNFALPGSMISDDYVVAKSMFVGLRKPRIVVLGLSLRDFIDSGVNCPAATPPFRYLKRFISIDDIIGLAMPQAWQRFDYYLGKNIYLWRKKLDCQTILAEGSKEKLNVPVAQVSAPSPLDACNPERNLPSNLRSEVEEHMFIVQAHEPYSWQDNSGEYRKRYRTGLNSLFKIETQFFDKLLDYLQNENIKVVLVNMPLTAENMSLMPTGSYQAYLAVLQQAARDRKLVLLDLNGKQWFSKSDFYDTSHMNAAGGKKLADRILSSIAANRELLSALNNLDTPERALAAKREGIDGHL